jgi:hypothetical protein
MFRTVAGILLLGFAALPAGAQPTIGFEENAVVASGVTPGGSVVWFGIARERPGRITQVVRRDTVLPDSDGDGVVRLDLGRRVATESIWAAVDLGSGAFVVATPEGMPRREVALPGNSFRHSPRGAVEALQDAREFLEILVVRPGEGAWSLSVGDGGDSDADLQPNGSIRAALASMHPIQSSKAAPDQLLPGDVVVVVDPRQMEFYTTTLGKAL